MGGRPEKEGRYIDIDIGDIHIDIDMADSLHCTAETNIRLYPSFFLMQMHNHFIRDFFKAVSQIFVYCGWLCC